MRARLRLPLVVGVHLLISAAAASVFAREFSHNWRAVVAHLFLLTQWDLSLAAALVALVSIRPEARWPVLLYRALMVLTCTAQIYLYALSAVSNLAWGRNMTGHLVSAFAPTVWSGKEPFPIGPIGISLFAFGAFA